MDEAESALTPRVKRFSVSVRAPRGGYVAIFFPLFSVAIFRAVGILPMLMLSGVMQMER